MQHRISNRKCWEKSEIFWYIVLQTLVYKLLKMLLHIQENLHIYIIIKTGVDSSLLVCQADESRRCRKQVTQKQEPETKPESLYFNGTEAKLESAK